MKAKRYSGLVTWGGWLLGVALVFALFVAVDLPAQHSKAAMYALWALWILVSAPFIIWQGRKARREDEPPQATTTWWRPRNVALGLLACAISLLVLSC